MAYQPPVPKTVRVVRFTGLDGKSDPKTTIAGKMAVVENAYAVRRTDPMAGYEYRKRYGITNLATTVFTGGNIAVGADILQYGNSLLETDGLILYSLINTASKWMKIGKVTTLSATSKAIYQVFNQGGTVSKPSVDIAYLSGYIAVAVTRPADTRLEIYIIDSSTGEFVYNQSFSSTKKAKVVASGDRIHFFYWDGTNTLVNIYWDPATQAFSGSANIATNLHTSGIYDVTYDTVNTRFIVAYRNTTPTLTLVDWSNVQVASNSLADATDDPSQCIGFLYHNFSNSNGYLAVGTSGVNGVRTKTFTLATNAVTNTTTVDATVTNCRNVNGYFASPSRVVHYDVPGASTQNDRIGGWVEGTSFSVFRSVSLASKIWKIGTRYYCNAAYESTIQRHLYTLEFESLASGNGAVSIVGYLQNTNGGGRASEQGTLPNAAAISGTNVRCVWQAVDGPTQVLNYTVLNYDLNWTKALTGSPFEFNGVALFPGAIKMTYDGNLAVEAGFLVQPEAPTLGQTTGGSLTLTGIYSVILVYKWIDNTGKLWRSVASPASSITLTGGNNLIQVTAGTCRITMKETSRNIGTGALNAANVAIEVYATKTLESTYYRVGEVGNSTGADTASFNISGPDSSFTGELLYTTGGVVANVTTVMPNVQVAFRNRVFDIAGDGTVYYSQETRSGLSTHMGDGFKINPDRSDGDFQCGGAIDLSLILFKRSSIYILQGDGPAFNGSGSYPSPYLLTAKEGATNSRAVGITPDGLLFKSQKGMRVLSRSLDVIPVEGSEAYDSLTINGTMSMDDRPFCLFVTAEGRTLVYDWVFRTFYTWTGQAAVGCCRWQNKFTILNTNGTVSTEVVGQYNDNGAAITPLLTLQWVNLADVFGNSRLYKLNLLGDMMASFTLSCTVGYDYGAVTADAAKTKAVTVGTIGPLEIRPGYRTPQAVQVSLTETSTTQGFVFQALGIEVLTKTGARKQLPANRLV